MDIPDQVGPYKPISLLGQGPLTYVCSAEHDTLQRLVALKILRGNVPLESTFAESLIREAHVLSRIRGPQVPALFEFNAAPGSVWMALELIHGPTLKMLLEAHKAPLPISCCVAILLGLCSVLSTLHQQRVIHQKIQPSNILMNATGQVYLIDFSHAFAPQLPKPVTDVDPAGASLTPSYLSPEQIVGEDATSSTDLFSLGIIAYEMISGVRPFDGPDVRTVTQRLRHDDPASLRTYSPNIPRALERWVEINLSKSPADRFESIEEAWFMLKEITSGLPQDPTRDLIQLLARLHLIDPKTLPVQLAPALQTKRTFSLARAASGQLLSLAALVGGGMLIQTYVPDPVSQEKRFRDPSRALELTPENPGNVRVVARPWASVYVDGQFVDVTPFAKPIPLRPGNHQLSFRHPTAPEENRSITVQKGQNTLVEVEMKVPERPKPVDSGRLANAQYQLSAVWRSSVSS